MSDQIFDFKLFSQINDDMRARFMALQNRVTDLNEGSVTASLIEAIAMEIGESYLRAKTGFDRYLPQLAFNVFGFERKEGLYSAGAVVFSRQTASPDAITIPIGTVVSTASGIQFQTTSTGTIPATETVSSVVAVRSIKTGQTNNVAADSITTLNTSIPGVTAVSNPAATSGGQDDEAETEYVLRFQNYLRGLSGASRSGILSAVQALPAVRSASIIEHFPPLSDIYNFSLYIDDGAGNAPQALVDEVGKVVFGDDTPAYPGKIAAGVNARILGPTAVPVDVAVEIVSDGQFPDEVLIYNVTTQLRDFVNASELGQAIIVNRVRTVVMQVLGVYDFTLSLPASNIIVGPDQIARFNSATVSVAT